MWMKVKWTCVGMIIGVALCTCGVLRAQDTAAGGGTKRQVVARNTDPDWEVATVKPNILDDGGHQQRIHLRGHHVTLEDHTVQMMLRLGYVVQEDQILALPDWAKTQGWDVDGLGNSEGQPNLRQLQAMIRKILVERFGLKLHEEQRELPAFALIVTKEGSKHLTANTTDPDGLMDQQNSETNWQHTERLKNTSMPDLALILQFHVDRPIVDRTGLKGRYDFDLQWTPDEAVTTRPDAPPGLFTAIQDQLGLKLEPMKAPVKVLMIDKVERPGAN